MNNINIDTTVRWGRTRYQYDVKVLGARGTFTVINQGSFRTPEAAFVAANALKLRMSRVLEA